MCGMESLKIIEFLEKCEHVQAFKRVKPMIVRMVDLRCDSEKVGAYRFKLYPDVAKLDLLARHLYLFQIQTYIQPAFLKRDFKVLALVMGLDQSLVQEIFMSIRGAPHNSDFRNEHELVMELMTPIVKELDLANDFNTDSEHGLMQWICGHLILNPKFLRVWDRPKLEQNLLIILENNLAKYLGDVTPVHKNGLLQLRDIHNELTSIRKNSLESLNIEKNKLHTAENPNTNQIKELIFDYPLERSIAYWLGLATYGGFLFLFLILEYFWLGFVFSFLPSYWVFKTSVHDKRLVFYGKEEFEIHRNGKKFKLFLEDILRVERFENSKIKGIRLVFRNSNLEPLEVFSNFDQYAALLHHLESSVIGDRILNPAECMTSV